MGSGYYDSGATAMLRSAKVKESSSKGYDARSTGTFTYHEDVKSGKAAGIHPSLDPSKMKDGRRESRDSAEHPNSNAVACCIDVTGSMSDTPKTLFDDIGKLMSAIVKNNALDDPQVLYAAVGDAYCDKYPFQVGQFESDNASEAQISDVILEGGGGGNSYESYDLWFYFLARCTSIDCFEKRGKKGYAFLIQDEPVPPCVPKVDVRKVFGQTIQADIPFADIVKEAQEKWDIFILRPMETSWGRRENTAKEWEKYFPNRVFPIQTVKGIAGQIAMIIANEEGVDLDSVADTLIKAGTSSEIVLAAKDSVVKKGGGIVKAKSEGDIDLS